MRMTICDKYHISNADGIENFFFRGMRMREKNSKRLYPHTVAR